MLSAPAYHDYVNQILLPSTRRDISVVDLFCGCGGLSLGLEAGGFDTLGFEGAQDAACTAATNLKGSVKQEWIDQAFECPKAQVLVGGPPCQPFSELGLRLGKDDARDGFPSFIRSVGQTKPDIWMFENVPGLLRQESYFAKIVRRLRGHGYRVVWRVVNAAHFGVPQNRKRLVVIGCRKGEFRWPTESVDPVDVRAAIGTTMSRWNKTSRFLTSSMEEYIARYEAASKCVRPRDLHPDTPARTVTCRNLAGATGDMLRVKLPDGRRRMLSVREAARLQSFPDWFKFRGGLVSHFTQIGNAVPPLLAFHFANSIREHLGRFS